ncbi:hypothetical protein ACWDY4_33905 [Streptomyces olivaceoviridis]
MLTGKTKHSLRDARIRYAGDPENCPVRAWTAYRERLIAEHGPRWADPSTPAFVGIDRCGHITGGMGPDPVTRAINRISARASMPIAWTGHAPRIGGGRARQSRPGAAGFPGRPGRRHRAVRRGWPVVAERCPG